MCKDVTNKIKSKRILVNKKQTEYTANYMRYKGQTMNVTIEK